MTCSTEKELHLYLTLTESSLLLEALIECPFKLVFELIGRLNQQAQQFYQPHVATGDIKLFALSSAEISCCIKALGNFPFNRVNLLLGNIQKQLQTQQVTIVERVNGDV